MNQCLSSENNTTCFLTASGSQPASQPDNGAGHWRQKTFIMTNGNAPFFVGQEVVALRDAANRAGIRLVKGRHYTVLAIQPCSCGKWKVDIGLFDARAASSICKCGKIYEGSIVWCNSNILAPIERTRIVYVAVSEQIKKETEQLILS